MENKIKNKNRKLFWTIQSPPTKSRDHTAQLFFYPLNDYQHTILGILSFSILFTWPNHQRTSSTLSSAPFVTPHNSYPCIQGSILSPNTKQASEVELKRPTFYSLLLFYVLLSFLFSYSLSDCGGMKACAHAPLVLCECIWNAPVVLNVR